MATESKKNNYMDIDALIDKVSKLPIPDTEKANLLRQFKENMMNPGRGEIENLNRIQSKYSNINPGTTHSPLTPSDFLPSINPNLPNQPYQPNLPNHPNLSQMPMSSMAMMMPSQQLQQLQPQQQGLTVAHFDVLKNKMDSIQLELVDLLRHVKDYTQRYMNATRQQDMEKIDAYINGLFEVDKQMKRAEEQAAVMAVEDEVEALAAGPEKSTITRATDGIKNFLGSIGDGVSGITSFVSSTANIVNDTLSKKVLGGTPTTASAPSVPATNYTNTNTRTTTSGNGTNTSSRGNIISVDDYIQSNMNQVEGASPISSSSKATSANLNNSSNNITSSNNINAMAPPEIKKDIKKDTKVETAESNQEEITAAINKLNDTMNADIDNTVALGQNVMNDSTPSTESPTGSTTKSQVGGGNTTRQENHLTKKIRTLRLRLTKQKLEEQLLNKTKDSTRIETRIGTGTRQKTKNRIANNKSNARTKKHVNKSR